MKPMNLSKNIRSVIALMLIGFFMLWLLLILILGYADKAFIDRTTAGLFGLIGGGIIGFYFAANHSPQPNTIHTETEIKSETTTQ